MSEQTIQWILGGIVAAVAFIAGRLWGHETRISSLEADNTQTKKEVEGLRQRFHDFRDDLTREIHQKLRDWKDDLLNLFGK